MDGVPAFPGGGAGAGGEHGAGVPPGGAPAGGPPSVTAADAPAVRAAAAGDPVPPPGGGNAAGQALEALYGVLFEPHGTFRRLAGATPSPGAAAAVVAGVGFLHGLVLPLAGTGVAATPGPWWGLLAVLVAVGSLVTWFVQAGIWQLLAELAGGQGSGRATLALTGLAHLPLAFIPPLVVLARWAGWWPVELLALPVSAWSVGLAVLAVQAAHRLSAGRAVAVVLTPLLALAALLAAGVAALLALGWTLTAWP